MNTTVQELKAMFKLALPVCLTQLAFMMMNLVDAAVVGQVSAAELAGVAAGNLVFWSAFVVALGLFVGMDAFVSQAYGARHLDRCDLGLTVGLVLAGLTSLILVPLLWWVSGHLTLTGMAPDVIEHALPYLGLTIWSLPLCLFFAALQRYWQSMNQPLMPMVVVFIGNFINYLGLLTWVPEHGAYGAALATLWARVFTLTAIVAISLIAWRRRFGGRWMPQWRWDRDVFRQLLSLGLPSSGQILLEYSAFALVGFVIATLGAQQLASHHIVHSVVSFIFMLPLGMSVAVGIRVGHFVGAGAYSEARVAGSLGIKAGATLMAVCGVLIYAARHYVVRGFTTDADVATQALALLVPCAVFQIVDAIQAIGTGALRGVGDTRSPFIANLIGHYLCGLPVGFLLAFRFKWGSLGFWWGLTLGLVIVALLVGKSWRQRSRHIQRLAAI